MRYEYTTDDADYVRTLIDPIASVENIPEATIINEYSTGNAEDWAFTIVTPAAEALLTPEQHETVKRAVLLYLASSLIQETPVVTRGQMSEGSYTVASGDPLRRAGRLERQARAILSSLVDLVTPAAEARSTFVFMTAPGRRGK